MSPAREDPRHRRARHLASLCRGVRGYRRPSVVAPRPPARRV